ncbi:hypothetical protein F4778DRAFT_794551 [Xylariomycetidae sp. FL2044]|nr:hypothetical protein F4778DRAFT_794551 [Xylariomycetidae sp. FL2044]
MAPGAFTKIPMELVVMVLKDLSSERDIKAFALTCRQFNSAWKGHKHDIIKKHIEEVIPDPSTLKIALLEVEARKVDASDEASVTKFMDKFMIPGADIDPTLHSTFKTAEKVRSTYDALHNQLLYTLKRQPLNVINFRFTPSESERVVRSFLILEIEANLFWRAPEGETRLFFTPTFPELRVRYWNCFSHGERGQAIWAREISIDHFRVFHTMLENKIEQKLPRGLWDEMCGIEVTSTQTASYWYRRASLRRFTNEPPELQRFLQVIKTAVHARTFEETREPGEKMRVPPLHEISLTRFLEDPHTINDRTPFLRTSEVYKFLNLDMGARGYAGLKAVRWAKNLVILDKERIAEIQLKGMTYVPEHEL